MLINYLVIAPNRRAAWGWVEGDAPTLDPVTTGGARVVGSKLLARASSSGGDSIRTAFCSAPETLSQRVINPATAGDAGDSVDAAFS